MEKKHRNRNENAFNGLISRLDMTEGKKSLSQRLFQQKPPKVKNKDNKDCKKETLKDCGKTTKGVKYT